MVFSTNSAVIAVINQWPCQEIWSLEMWDPCQRVREEHHLLPLQMGFLERASTFYIWDIYIRQDQNCVNLITSVLRNNTTSSKITRI